MTQRKLTNEELEKVIAARENIRTMVPWHETNRGVPYWHGVVTELDQMVYYATTDGQPYVDPEPPIPDGWRLAVAGDEGRSDRKFRDRFEQKWVAAVRMSYAADVVFIVPADRTPTDEDARSRPEVMVRNRDDCKWQKYTLLAVFESRPEIRFMCLYDNGSTYATWKQCRHLYPGE